MHKDAGYYHLVGAYLTCNILISTFGDYDDAAKFKLYYSFNIEIIKSIINE